MPFGNAGAWAITLPKVLVLGGVLVAQSAHVWLFCGAFNVAVSLAYLFWSNVQRKARRAASALLKESDSAATAYGTGSLL